MATTGFRGFPQDAIDFYAELTADNSKAFWEANKHRYQTSIKEPFAELSEAVAEAYGPLRLFRPHRDVRFSKDKSPYKTAAGAATESEGGSIYYVAISADGLMVGNGYYRFAHDQLAKYRDAVDDGEAGPKLVAACAAVRKAGLDIGGEALKSAPRGYPKDHERIELLRHKGLYVMREVGAPAWLHTKAALGHITKTWDATRPVTDWLDAHVGPSEEAPPGFGD